ncbi:MAG TPA: M20/M25/M40 family metallo-hydrolase, partial [Thermoanaerobaculia bacterium]|nr:M20/M25/M40 family metallo-hydrolase [Thermoanaerobaculia bacterium]
DHLGGYLDARGVAVDRIGDTLIAVAGDGPVLLFDSHLDTVPPCAGWSRDPFVASVVAGRVYGLGANDAKASVAAMVAAFLALSERPAACAVALALVAGEETTSQGTREALDRLAARGRPIAAAVFGEPTGLDLAVAQKGLLVVELRGHGRAAHAAHAHALAAPNAIRQLARDLVALDAVDLGPAHPELGPTTIEPTVVRAGTARNVVPDEALAVLDIRITPALPAGEVVTRLRAGVTGDLDVRSSRFSPRATPPGSALLAAARSARAEARSYGSATLSDWALLPEEVPGIKVGPGLSERSHTPDEFVLEEEVLAGAVFYEALARAFVAEERP